jgi:hypothetical protein
MNLKKLKIGQVVVVGNWDTIHHMDEYFADCEETGQGIGSKEHVQMMNAMMEVIKKEGVGAALDLDKKCKSKTAKSMARNALLKVHPGFDKLFQKASTTIAQAIEQNADGKFLQPLEMSAGQISEAKAMIEEMFATHSLEAAELEYGNQLKRIKTVAEQICSLLSGMAALK